MKYSYTIFLCTLLGGGAFAANSKLNQYASISDCQNDVNIISHASPVEGSCHSVDSRTGALFLVTGGGADGAVYFGIDALDQIVAQQLLNRCRRVVALDYLVE
ncbi:hypothetical protein N431DRAFT_466844 [Stipitochalara longipes BDJ]|nr:hypothetical protein N431DRAFT_466844 [Stipitochalara longipes BDJ]